MPKITFLPDNITIEVEEGETILKAAIRAGIHINASCGGAGVCNKCRVFVEKGEVKGETLPDGGWKACTTVPVEDIEVRIPVESQMDRKALKRPLATRAASWIKVQEKLPKRAIEPIVRKPVIILPEPSLEDQASDLDRTFRGISQALNVDQDHIHAEPELLLKLPYTLREENWKISPSVFLKNQYAKILRIEPGDKSKEHLGVAIDIGTTTVSAQLIDLNTGDILSESSNYNPQVSYGEDVISRMEFAKKGDGLKLLKEKIVNCLNELIKEDLNQAKSKREHISVVSIAANTVMTHFLLGLETKFLRAQPYIPVASRFPVSKAKDIGLETEDYTQLILAPCVASYVGGDIVSGVVGVGMHKQPELTLFIDIGTNGEIVLGNQEWMVCAACSAGPAFEGGGIKFGMRATTGAVEVVHIHPETYEPMVLTIGGKKAKGICGSGIISLLAGLFMTGAIDRQGKFKRDLNTPRIREGRDGWEYVVVEEKATAIGQDIVFTEADIENLIRAKGAMYAGYQTLLDSVGMGFDDLERIILAGNFGSYLDLEQAITIGLMPDIAREKFFFAGNTSLLGAKEAALSSSVAKEMDDVCAMMTHFDLSDNPQFMQYYVSALFLPHTDMNLFPTIKEALNI